MSDPNHCGSCKMFWQGKCWGYGNITVDPLYVCDSWTASGTKELATVEPTAKWFERLLSQDKLREAFDGARDNIEQKVGPTVKRVAANAAAQVASGGTWEGNKDRQLEDALAQHYTDLYNLGHETVGIELAKQQRALGTSLDKPTDTAAGGAASRLGRIRARAQHSAQNIANAINAQLGRDQITGLKDEPALLTLAQRAALGQLRVEALANTAASVNDGRYDAAMSAPDVVGAFYTSCLDERTCDACEEADDGELLSPSDAVALGPPNPDCAGADYCRCTLVWVTSDDPAALGAVT